MKWYDILKGPTSAVGWLWEGPSRVVLEIRGGGGPARSMCGYLPADYLLSQTQTRRVGSTLGQRRQTLAQR